MNSFISKIASPAKVTNESFNTRLLDNLTTAVVVLDKGCCLHHMNPAAEALLETSDRHSHKAHVRELLRNGEVLEQAVAAVRKTNTTMISRRVELLLPSGNKLLVDHATSIVNDQGSIFFLLELQEINRSWSLSRKETQLAKHEITVEMIRGLSHEIKNPLGGIRGAAQLLASELPNSQLQDYTNVIIEETDRLVNLVDRLTGPYKKPVIRSLNIHEVVERVRSLIEAETKGSIKMVRDYDPSLPEISGDLEQLIQAVLNIVRNAMQALTENPRQKEPPQIILRTRAVTHATIATVLYKLIVRIEIIDNGPGIPADIIENIFYPLISGRAEGTGLGLSIAQSIIKNHSGLIECESQEGRTRFLLSIPIQSEEGKDGKGSSA
ncbi:MAG TPA: nitrogen regulation protein NR(II) [Candidatus Acidoferrum sp.]|nr:nitrogen regulation protein NR(II) [Candidatus Acidoferrum sp.]